MRVVEWMLVITSATANASYRNYSYETSQDFHRRSRRQTKCTEDTEGGMCDEATSKICLKGECVSTCAVKNMRSCTCTDDADRGCYPCCGSSTLSCSPAHYYNIYKPNGEWWERPTCYYCRKNGARAMGKQCDDLDKRKVCYDKKCNGALCASAPEGKYCIQKGSTNRICADGHCLDPCSRKDLRMCECSIASIYRCELCCTDSQGKCQSAKEVFRIHKRNGDPYPRAGLTCGRYDWTCNAYAQCRAAPSLHLPLSTMLFSLCLILSPSCQML